MKHIHFLRYLPVYFSLSAVVVGAGLSALVVWGLKPSIDFIGGSLIQVGISVIGELQPSEETIRAALSDGGIDAHSIQQTGEGDWVIRTKLQGKDVEGQITGLLTERFGSAEASRFESVGPTLGKELLTKTVAAIILSTGGILLYVAWRFRGGKYGICADLAMIHDSLVVIGVFSILGHFRGMEVDTLFVTALLTILSFSVHDTIVVYDRIRENLRKFPQESFEAIADRSINETMGRSINNSLTIMFMLLALTLLGGETVKPFALALLVGTITGTYSSPFVAVPLLVVWERWEEKRKRQR